MTTTEDRRRHPRPLPLDDRTATERYEDDVWKTVHAAAAVRAAAKAGWHAECDTCEGAGEFVVPAGAPGNMSAFTDTEFECRDCQGTGCDPDCAGCRDEVLSEKDDHTLVRRS